MDNTLRWLISQGEEISSSAVEQIVRSEQEPPAVTDVNIEAVDLNVYGRLLGCSEVLVG